MLRELARLILFFGLVAGAGVSLAEPKSPISKPDLPFVDAVGIWTDPSGKKPGEGSGLAGAGTGAGKSSGNHGGAGKGLSGSGTEFTQPGGGDQGGGQKIQIGGDAGAPGRQVERTTPGGNIRVHSLYWPICAFVDASVSETTANSAFKGMIEMADRCGVNVVVFPKTVESGSWTDDYEAINSAQRSKCNIPGGKGSTTSLVPWPLTAARMCDDRKDTNNDGDEDDFNDFDDRVAGCAELAQGASLTPEQEARSKSSGHGSNKASDGVAVSIEVPNGHNASTVAHEAQGHSQFGKPNGAIHGNGIGEDEEKEGNGGPGDWSASGCAQMRATALPNTKQFGFDPSRETYYVKPRDPSGYYNIASDPPIFGPSPPVQGGGGALPPAQKNPPIGTPPGQMITMKDDPKPSPKATLKEEPTTSTKSTVMTMEDGEDSRHRRKGGAAAALLGSAVEGGFEPEGFPKVSRTAGPPPPGVPVKSGARITFDDGAAKGRSITGQGTSVTSAERPPNEAQFFGESFDDFEDRSVSQGVSMGGGNFGGGSGAGASITFDDNAPKGGITGGAPAGFDRGPASVGGVTTETTSTRTTFRAGSGSWRSSDSNSEEEGDDFFSDDSEDEKKKRKKKSLVRRTPKDLKAVRRPAGRKARR